MEGARALTLDADAADGPAEAFMIEREFCHVHAQGDFSLHAALPFPLAAAAERAGWAEPHFFVPTGRAPATIVMLYAPRDRAEHDVVLGLVRASYEFALAWRPRMALPKSRNNHLRKEKPCPSMLWHPTRASSQAAARPLSHHRGRLAYRAPARPHRGDGAAGPGWAAPAPAP